jgi:murein DD-endopeptidase MepM/ murein hydrolase activator NlpD
MAGVSSRPMSNRRLNLLLVRADGTRVLGLTVPRWTLAVGIGGLVLVVLFAIGSLRYLDDYLTLRAQRETLIALSPRLAEQQALIDLYQQRMRELRAEVDGWREVHAKIWAPFGPNVGPATLGPGIGGGTASSPLDGPSDRENVKDELVRLWGSVRQEGENLRSLERFLSRAGKLLASLPSRWPLRGPINSDFGTRLSPWATNAEFHSGLDIGAAIGTAVHAPAPGIVVFAGRLPEYGIALILEHGNDTKSLYGHLSRLNVGLDQKIERGQLIALTGNTGRSSGPHLHYEIQVKGQPVDPHTYLWE